MLKAVTLDLWNTLIADTTVKERMALRAQRLREMTEPFGVCPTDSDLERAFKASWAHFDRVWIGRHRTPTTDESATVLLAELGVAAPPEAQYRIARMMEDLILEAPPAAVPGAVDVLRRLREERGLRLALISDTGLSPGRTLRVVLARLGLLEHLDVLYFSDEGGMSKPDVRVFHGVLRDLGEVRTSEATHLGEVRPNEAVHVGDMERTDIAGARAAGMRAVHFVGVSDADLAVSTADAVLRDFTELPALLDRLDGVG